MVGADVLNCVLSFLNGGDFPSKLNYTYIVLIPKVQNPESMSQFRPISLCNVLYKIISKVLANRLKIILPTIISENQSVFVPGRLMTDIVLVAFEINHYLKCKNWGKEGHISLKLDMSKAYDRLEWIFIYI